MGETAGYRVEHAHTYSLSEKLQLVELFEYFDGTVLGSIKTSWVLSDLGLENVAQKKLIQIIAMPKYALDCKLEKKSN